MNKELYVSTDVAFSLFDRTDKKLMKLELTPECINMLDRLIFMNARMRERSDMKHNPYFIPIVYKMILANKETNDDILLIDENAKRFNGVKRSCVGGHVEYFTDVKSVYNDDITYDTVIDFLNLNLYRELMEEVMDNYNVFSYYYDKMLSYNLAANIPDYLKPYGVTVNPNDINEDVLYYHLTDESLCFYCIVPYESFDESEVTNWTKFTRDEFEFIQSIKKRYEHPSVPHKVAIERERCIFNETYPENPITVSDFRLLPEPFDVVPKLIFNTLAEI